jgi:hypothetical protein
LGVHLQTVQRCIERALVYGPLMALDDRPRPGKEPTITPEAKAWLVSLACDKAKEHGYAYQQITDDFGQPAVLGGFPLARSRYRPPARLHFQDWREPGISRREGLWRVRCRQPPVGLEHVADVCDL